MESINNIIFLDLDGVLITTFPVWKKDEMDTDWYSKFNPDRVRRLQELLVENESIKIVMSSSRRVGKSLEQLEEILAYRGLANKLIAKIPDPRGDFHPNRLETIVSFINEHKIQNYLIIDDDKSLLKLSPPYNKYLVLTQYRYGFDEDAFQKAKVIIDKW